VDVDTPPINRHPAAIAENEIDAMAAIADFHDCPLSTSNVSVGFIMMTRSQTTPLEIEDIVFHEKSGVQNGFGFNPLGHVTLLENLHDAFFKESHALSCIDCFLYAPLHLGAE
jgi:hypothetical protein